jgi:hypothetical protein
MKKKRGDDAPSISNCRLAAGEKCSHEAVNRVVAQMPRYTGGFNH